MYVCKPNVYRDVKPRGGHRIALHCEPPGGCWKSNPHPLGIQPVLVTTEPAPFTGGFYSSLSNLTAFRLSTTLLVRVSITAMKHLTKKKVGEERFYLTYT